MRLLFMATLAKTLHETTVGLDLVHQLKSTGVRCHFVIDADNEAQLKAAGHPYTVVTSALGHGVRDVVARTVREFRPDAIVLSDYIGHWLTHLVNYETDPWYVQEFGVPVLPIDMLGLADTEREVEVLGRTVTIDANLLDMPLHLRPVPVNRPQRPAGPNGMLYRANSTLRPLTERTRAEVRRSVGAEAGHRLLLFPTLPWQHTMQTRAGPATRELAVRLPELIGHYLRRLPADTRFVMVGPYFETLGLPPDRVHFEPTYTADRYHRLLGAADAVMSCFLTSYALERAILADVPGLVATNGHDLPAGAPAPSGLSPAVRSWLADFPGPLPSFHAWPLRWSRMLSGLLHDNPFSDTVLNTEIFDEDAVVNGLEAVLYDPVVRDRLAGARADYRDALDRLPDTARAFTAAAERLGIGR
ncbi:DUF6365 family protein [Streptomyces sp. NPDC090054]|uniref:DUF6365 family protein n=1 Tax=unclassified Streptomyces TaxID=2593676 RepID=UPI0029A41040|nr:DUF6365 family protein [Streptomyces sp. DK15]MDX2394215.1 DUF6365 family protein [Streptomyces sp. DK15]